MRRRRVLKWNGPDSMASGREHSDDHSEGNSNHQSGAGVTKHGSQKEPQGSPRHDPNCEAATGAAAPLPSASSLDFFRVRHARSALS
jgi:hypothetical protein